MREGLLWFDDDPRRSIDDKIALAAARYQKKFGAAPDMCYVNSALIEREALVGAVQVRSLATIRPNHFWIGREETTVVIGETSPN